MEGYVVNASPEWAYALKRSVCPGGKIPLKELYAQYGIKHGLSDNEEFLTWLRNIKLKDKERWRIITDTPEDVSNNTPETIVKATDSMTPFVTEKLSVADISTMSVRRAREVIPGLTDIKLLQYALREANQLANKDSLCRILKKRIDEIQGSRQ